ncbi:MAG: alpha/beta hydrolase, partial [Lachnospiraceae bacterium]|nr:alpha/beta hydrolase [Lachnospiraceae bacterium]
KRDGMTILGMQYFPDGFDEDRKYAAVIVSHGFTGNYTDMAEYCRAFAGEGYAAFSFSFCGGGVSAERVGIQSEGRTTDMTISTEVKDLLAVKNFVTGQSFVDKENLILAGGSQGGFVSGLAAAKCGNEIKKLIMIYPALCIPDHARRGCLGGSKYDSDNVPEIIDCGVTMLGKAMHEDVADMDPYLELSAYQGPVLILQGLADEIVNYSYAVRAKENYKKGQCHLQLIRDVGHGFDAGQFESAFASIRQFLKEREEILTIRVIITHSEKFEEDGVHKTHIYFTGYCDTEYFQGTILPEGCDVREYDPETSEKVRAEYTLAGIDSKGEKCSIRIVNKQGEKDWKPEVETDSPILSWMNHADLTAVLENGNGGPTVRIFADRRAES